MEKKCKGIFYLSLGTERCRSAQLVHLPQTQKAHLSRTYSVPERLPTTSKEGQSGDRNNNNKNPRLNKGGESQKLYDRIQLLQKDVTDFHTLLLSDDCTATVASGDEWAPFDREQKEICEGLKHEYAAIKEQLWTLENKSHDVKGVGGKERIRAYSANSRYTLCYASYILRRHRNLFLNI